MSKTTELRGYLKQMPPFFDVALPLPMVARRSRVRGAQPGQIRRAQFRAASPATWPGENGIGYPALRVCKHERLNEEGQCRECGADRRGL
jgi:hypothetical protein